MLVCQIFSLAKSPVADSYLSYFHTKIFQIPQRKYFRCTLKFICHLYEKLNHDLVLLNHGLIFINHGLILINHSLVLKLSVCQNLFLPYIYNIFGGRGKTIAVARNVNSRYFCQRLSHFGKTTI